MRDINLRLLRVWSDQVPPLEVFHDRLGGVPHRMDLAQRTLQFGAERDARLLSYEPGEQRNYGGVVQRRLLVARRPQLKNNPQVLLILPHWEKPSLPSSIPSHFFHSFTLFLWHGRTWPLTALFYTKKSGKMLKIKVTFCQKVFLLLKRRKKFSLNNSSNRQLIHSSIQNKL